jgi:CheY-like chemotaxis protein
MESQDQNVKLRLSTILLIADDKKDRTFWSHALRNSAYQYSVLEADSGESGLDVCRHHTVDCVVLDLDMPESGLFTLVQLIPDCERPRMPVVVLTKLMQVNLLELVKKYGAFACMVKHLCSTEDVARTIQQAIGSAKSLGDGA